MFLFDLLNIGSDVELRESCTGLYIIDLLTKKKQKTRVLRTQKKLIRNRPK